MVSTHLKNISQIGNLPQIGVEIKNIWNHQVASFFFLIDCKVGRFILQQESPKNASKESFHFCPTVLYGHKQKMRKEPWNHPPIYRIYIGWSRSLGGYRHKNGWRINQSPLTMATPPSLIGVYIIAGLLKGKPMINKLSSGRLVGFQYVHESHEKFGPGHGFLWNKITSRRSWATKKKPSFQRKLQHTPISHTPGNPPFAHYERNPFIASLVKV